MKKIVMLTMVLALVVASGSLRAELSSVNLFDQQVDPGFEGADLSDWTVVSGSTAVDNTTSSTGDSSMEYNAAAWVPTVLGISDGNEDYALGLPDMLPAASDTDYFTGAWVKDDAASAAAYLYFSTYNGGTGGWEETCAFPTPYILTGGTPTTDWVFYRSIINSGNTYGNGMGFTVNGNLPFNVDDVVAAEITDPNTPHVLAWDDDSAKKNAALDLRGYVEAGNGPTAGTITSTTWSKVSGPGGVIFGDASLVDTTATFDTAGTYTLQLQAVDSAAHTVTVTADYVVATADPASAPSPADASEHVSVNTDLGWTPGAQTQDVYFDAGTGAPSTLVASGDGTLSTVANSALNGGSPLDPNAVYSWQVIGYVGATPYPGPVWSFRTAVGLMYHWPLDGNLNEVIVGNNGTPTGTISYVTGVDGNANTAMAFSPTEYATSISNLGIVGNTPRTVNCWFKVPNDGLSAGPFGYGTLAGNGTLYEIWLGDTANHGDKFFGHFHGWDATYNGYDTLAETSVSYPMDTWVMATVVYDGTDVTVYQDAYLIATKTLPLATVDSPGLIGRADGVVAYGSPNGTGAVDDVRVYDYALTESEVLKLYLGDREYICTDTDRPAMDFTDDCVVDLADFAVFALEWLDCGRYPPSTCP